jgi:hypothetical protein
MLRQMTRGLLGLGLGLTMAVGLAAAAGPFDGTYSGSRRETKSNNSGFCQNINRDQTQLVVANGVASYPWAKKTFEAPVKSDGTFEITGQGLAMAGASSITLKGKITGNNMEADIGNNSCAAHMSLKKS